MRHRLVALCAASAAFAVQVAAPPQALAAEGKGDRACFFANQLSNWKEVDDRTVHLRVGVRDIYQLKLVGECSDLRYAETIGIETTGGADHICSGLDVNLIVPSSVTRSIPRRCMATSLRKLSEEEAAALPKGQRP